MDLTNEELLSTKMHNGTDKLDNYISKDKIRRLLKIIVNQVDFNLGLESEKMAQIEILEQLLKE